MKEKIKSYTDLEQSKKLAEILPLESADMFYRDNGIDVKLMWEHIAQKVTNPCWSLAALLDILPISLNTLGNGRWNAMIQCDGEMRGVNAYNPIDACYELIIKLHELNLL